MSRTGPVGPALAPIEARTARVLAVGSELLAGVVRDTDTATVSAALTARGVRVREARILPDSLDALVDALRSADEDLIVTTGGLGPTHDDITRRAVSDALGVPLETDASLLERLGDAAARRADERSAARVLSQAAILRGARVLTPDSGTAPGQVLGHEGRTYVLLPGPPHELGPMLERVVEAVRSGAPTPRMLSCEGSESDILVLVEPVLERYADVTLTLVARAGEVRVLLFAETDGADLESAEADLRSALGARCASSFEDPVARLVRRATAASRTMAVAESCTGGLLAGGITSVPGSSSCFAGGVIAYSDGAKVSVLDVDPELLDAHGAVSGPVAEAMATGARRRLDADVAVSTTGIAGPGGGSPDKPIGTVYFGVDDGSVARSVPHHLGGDRAHVRGRAVEVAIRLLEDLLDTGTGSGGGAGTSAAERGCGHR